MTSPLQHTFVGSVTSQTSNGNNFRHGKCTNCIHSELPGQISYPLKPFSAFKKEWQTVKQCGWGAQASVFHIKPLTNTYTKSNMEYVAKIMYFTNGDIYNTLKDRERAMNCVIEEYKLITSKQLLHYTDFYYDSIQYTRAVIVMERLSHCLSSKRDCNWDDIYSIPSIARDIALNIKQIHDAHYVHLDIKKENIMYNQHEMKWKLIDYGFMRYIDPYKKYIGIHEYIGSKSWSAPEIKLVPQCDEANMISNKCDIYSFGLVLLNLVLGGYHFRVFVKRNSRNNLSADDDLDILRMLNTRSGNRRLQRYLLSLKENGILSRDLYLVLQRCLVFDVEKRADIDEILFMDYFKMI